MTDRPVRSLVNTHHHGDHTHGNYLFRPTAVIGHEQCREMVKAFGHPDFGAVFGPGPDFGHLELEPPLITFTDRLDVWVDDLGIELHYIGGAAHTDQRRRRLDPRAVGPLRRRPRLQRRDAVRGHGLGQRLARRPRPNRGLRGGNSSCPATATPAAPRSSAASAATSSSSSGHRRRRTQAGLSPLEAARETDLGQFAALLDPERIVGNLHRAYAELDGAAPGAPIDLLAAIGDMVTYNGGPLRCLA